MTSGGDIEQYGFAAEGLSGDLGLGGRRNGDKEPKKDN
jgi:hypothetical protein